MTDSARDLASIASESLSAEIDPLGAQLFALRDEKGRDLQWGGDPAVWTGRAPILFPIVGMLQDGRYRVDGETYALPKHGFARHMRFDLVEKTPSSATFRLKADAETRAVYPFEFELDIAFTVSASTLTLKASVRNLGDGSMPASFGFHPALRWPLPYGGERSSHTIRFEHDESAPIRRINAEGVVTPEEHPTPVVGREMRLRDDLFTDDAVIFDQLKSRRLRYGAPDGPHLDIAFPDTPYLGVWTKPGAGYICIEPWHGIADPEGYSGDFRDKPGVFEVEPGGVYECRMSITLHG
jgi:galactose mutarotase-like enzyme